MRCTCGTCDGSSGNAHVRSVKPPRAKACASNSVETVIPCAPRASWRRPSSRHLCVLMCGRSETPSLLARPAMVLRFRSITSRYSNSAGVSTSSIDATAANLHPFHPLDASRAADERRRSPACQAHDDGADRSREQARDVKSRNERGHECERDAVHDQDEEPERQHRQREGEDEDDWANDRVDHAEQQRGHDQGTGALEGETGKDLIGDPQAERGDQQSDKEASHGAEDNRWERPATNRAVIPGRACTPSLESRRIAPLSESRPAQAQASDRPAKGPRSAGQPVTIACSGCPNQLALTVAAPGARKSNLPRSAHAR